MNFDLCSLLGKYNFDILNSLVTTISRLSSMNGYEFEITVVDRSLIDKLELIETLYEDNCYEHRGNHRIDYKNGIIENKNVLTRLSLLETKLPLTVRFSKEDTVHVSEDIMEEIRKNPYKEPRYSRKQRISYRFVERDLHCWKLDKTVRFYTDSPLSKKLSTVLDKNNVLDEASYDILDYELEYTGTPDKFIKHFTKLLLVLFPNYFKEINSDYGSIKAFIGTDISKVFPSVSIIDQNTIGKLNLSHCLVSEKIDGERRVLIVFNNALYEYSSKGLTRLCKFESKSGIRSRIATRNTSITLVDSEKVGNTFYLFDIVQARQGKFTLGNFIDRYVLMDDFIRTYNGIVKLEKIRYFQAEGWQELIDFIETHSMSTNFSNIHIDGLVVRDNNSLYKLKNKVMSTIDCLVKYNKLDGYCYLFLVGNPKEVITSEPFTNTISKTLLNYNLIEQMSENNVYILFDSPFREDGFRVKLDDFEEYDGKIVEMQYVDDSRKWVPIRIRDDKEYSNNYRVGMSILSYIHSAVENNAEKGCYFDTNLLRTHFPINTTRKLSVLSLLSYPESISELYSAFPKMIGSIYLISKNKNVLGTVVKGIMHRGPGSSTSLSCKEFNDFTTMLSEYLDCKNTKFKQNDLVIIDDLFEYTPTYFHLYEMMVLLDKLLHHDGVALITVDLSKNMLSEHEPSIAGCLKYIIGENLGTKNDYSFPVKLGKTTYFVKVPASLARVSKSVKKTISNVKNILHELTDPITRFNNYLSTFEQMFEIDEVIVNESSAFVVLKRAK